MRLGKREIDTKTFVKVILSIVIILIIGKMLIAPFFESVKYAEKDFKPFVGYADSEDVGNENYDRFSNYKYSDRIIENSGNIGMFTAIIGAVYAFIAIWGIASIRRTITKALVAFLFILPAVIPVLLYLLLTKEFFMNELGVFEGGRGYIHFIVSIFPGIRFGALFAISGIFIKENPFDSALKLSLLCLGVGMALMFTSYFDYVFLISSPAMYESLETFSTYTYQYGLQSSSFSYGCAVGVIKGMYQLLPAAIGAIIAIFMFRNKPKIKRELRAAPVSGFSAAPLALVVFAVVMFVGGEFAKKIISFSTWDSAMTINWDIAIDIAKYTAIVFVVMAYAVRNLKAWGIAVCFVLIALGDNLISSFIMIKENGIMNTYAGVAEFAKYGMIPILALIGAFVMERRKSVLPLIGMFVAVLGIMIAWYWGEVRSSLICINDEAMYPATVLLRQFLFQSVMEDGGHTEMIKTMPWSYILIPMVSAAFAVIGGCFVDKLAVHIKEKYCETRTQNTENQ